MAIVEGGAIGDLPGIQAAPKKRGPKPTGKAKSSAQRKAEQRQRDMAALSGDLPFTEWNERQCLMALAMSDYPLGDLAWEQLGVLRGYVQPGGSALL